MELQRNGSVPLPRFGKRGYLVLRAVAAFARRWSFIGPRLPAFPLLFGALETGIFHSRMAQPLHGRAAFAALAGFLSLSIATGQDFAKAKKHWAFQPIVKPTLPENGSTNPIDAFLEVEMQKQNLKPAGDAPPSILLRRLVINLTGLPPTREGLESLLEMKYEEAVTHLLDSPQHGERWGRHWMDIWRYSDWFGREGKDRITNGLPHLWHWRDWIVESINENKGYDRMILEMLAGDEIAPSDPKVLRATGFLVRNRYRLDRNVPLMATVEHTGRAFLGLTMDCARCHEHKYDPITHQDYFAFRAFFEPIGFREDRLQGFPDRVQNSLPRVYDADLEAMTFLFEKGDERRPVKDQPIAPSLPRFFETEFNRGKAPPISEVNLPPDVSNPFLKDWVSQGEIERLEAEIASLQKKADDAVAKTQLAARQAQIEAIQSVTNADRKQTGANARKAAQAQHEFNLAKADETIALAEVKAAKFQEQLKTDPSRKAQFEAAQKEVKKAQDELEKLRDVTPGKDYQPLGEIYPDKSTGRRSSLARWLVSGNNPLTARVAVNHIWMRHFGEPLVPTVFDFGLAGKPPTHPELLDWLAAEFIESGWDMKHLHRLIVTSEAYRRTSSNHAQQTNFAIDPTNRYYWRTNPRRMEAETVRDSMLHLAGILDTTMGGPDLPVADADKAPRRSIYFKHSGVDAIAMLADFDSPNVIECYRRRESVVPQQALALFNSPLAQQSARLIARKLPETDFIPAVFREILCRPPTDTEMDECRAFLDQQARLLKSPDALTTFTGGPKKIDPLPSADPASRARENLVHVLLNHNDYVTIR